MIRPGTTRLRRGDQRPGLAVPVQCLVEGQFRLGVGDLRRAAVRTHGPATASRRARDVGQAVHVVLDRPARCRGANHEPLLAGPVQHLVKSRVVLDVVADCPAIRGGRATHSRKLADVKLGGASGVRHADPEPFLAGPVQHLVQACLLAREAADGPAVGRRGTEDSVENVGTGRGGPRGQASGQRGRQAWQRAGDGRRGARQHAGHTERRAERGTEQFS